MDKFGNFLLGLGLGVGVGLLFAPRSGEETRDMLLSKADEGKDYLKRQTDDLRGSAAWILWTKAVTPSIVSGTRSARQSMPAKQAYREKVDQTNTQTV